MWAEVGLGVRSVARMVEAGSGLRLQAAVMFDSRSCVDVWAWHLSIWVRSVTEGPNCPLYQFFSAVCHCLLQSFGPSGRSRLSFEVLVGIINKSVLTSLRKRLLPGSSTGR